MNEKLNLKKITPFLGVIFGIIVIALLNQFVFKAPSFDKQLMQVASEFNKPCPIMVDEETQLDNTIATPDNTFQYNYTLVNILKEEFDIQIFEETMRPLLLNNAKTNPDLKSFRDNKVNMAFYYKDKDGVFLCRISITADDYLDI